MVKACRGRELEKLETRIRDLELMVRVSEVALGTIHFDYTTKAADPGTRQHLLLPELERVSQQNHKPRIQTDGLLPDTNEKADPSSRNAEIEHHARLRSYLADATQVRKAMLQDAETFAWQAARSYPATRLPKQTSRVKCTRPKINGASSLRHEVRFEDLPAPTDETSCTSIAADHDHAEIMNDMEGVSLSTTSLVPDDYVDEGFVPYDSEETSSATDLSWNSDSSTSWGDCSSTIETDSVGDGRNEHERHHIHEDDKENARPQREIPSAAVAQSASPGTRIRTCQTEMVTEDSIWGYDLERQLGVLGF